MGLRVLQLPLAACLLFAAAGCQPTVSDRRSAASAAPPGLEHLIARAQSLEYSTPYVPPPGDALAHHAAGFAKIMCSAVFITGLSPEFAAENVGYFSAPYAERATLSTPVIDRQRKAVQVTLPDGRVRVARYFEDQGCVAIPIGAETVRFVPRSVARPPGPSSQPWPNGDVLPSAALPSEIDSSRLRQAIAAAFEPAEGMTAAFVVTWKGQVIGERYGVGITAQTPLESWSMAKSLTATLFAILLGQGEYRRDQPAPIPQWQTPGDPRAAIRIEDILQMSSGLRFRAGFDPDYDPTAGYPDHVYVYTGSDNAFEFVATRPAQWPPGKVGRYRNSDPVLINYLIRLAVERRGEDYASFPQRALFDRIGIRTMVMETDPFGNFLAQGYVYGSARDWARLGNLYLQDGMWNGQRILPGGWVDFVRSVAPAWGADGRPIYGAFFWINGPASVGNELRIVPHLPVPDDAYFMAGAGGQYTVIIPSHELVVVRMGHFKGIAPGEESFRRALALLIQAVPKRN